MLLDAHEIMPRLWQGSRPKTGHRVSRAGFTTVVFCADDYQPQVFEYPGVHVIRAPFDDGPYMPRHDLQIAVTAATEVARRLLAGEKILVTCIAGINRSGLVCALAMHKAFGYSGRSCIDLVRERRKLEDDSTPLRNQSFVDALMKLPGQELIVLPGLEPFVAPTSRDRP